MPPSMLQPLDFTGIDGWVDDDHTAALQAFLGSAHQMQSQPYKTRALGVCSHALQQTAARAIDQFGGDKDISPSKARDFFETHFQPRRVISDTGTTGLLTGYFEPVEPASRTKSPQFPIPIYRRPPDLIDIDATNRPAHMDEEMRYGCVKDGSVSEYLDRKAIQEGALEGQGLELVYVKDKTTAFFIHVQGSAHLLMDDGTSMRITYAAKSGHRYSSLGKIVCERTGILPAEMTADKLASWMRNHPHDIDALLACNRSYIFFEQSLEAGVVDVGPIAAAKVPLVAGRSIAIDRTLHTFGAPIWLSTNKALPGNPNPLRRLMVAHDTGSAITGPMRADIFMGSGADAGLIAGRVRHDVEMVLLVPRQGGLVA